MSGWVSIERDLWDHPLFDREPMSEREAWIWMVANAAWANTSHRVGGELVDVPRGSFMNTLRGLQSVFMWRSDKKVRNFLKRLENEGMIGRTTIGTRNAPKTHVTICNYDKYQAAERTKDAPRTHRGRTEDAVKEQGNKGTRKDSKESLVKSASKKKYTPLPEGWQLPKDWGDWALDQGMDEVSIRREAAQFEDHHRSKDNTMADWRRAWQTWVRNALKWQNNKRGGQTQDRPGYVNAGAFGMIPEVGG